MSKLEKTKEIRKLTADEQLEYLGALSNNMKSVNYNDKIRLKTR